MIPTVVITIDRAQFGAKNYFRQTYQSIKQEVGECLVLNGDPNVEWLKDMDCNPTPMTQELFDQIKDKPVKIRGTVNYIRGLMGGFIPALVLGILLCEDDILLTQGFVRKLNAIRKAIPVEQYVLSLYNPHERSEKPYCQLKPRDFYGTQAIWFPPSVRLKLLGWMQARISDYVNGKPLHDFSQDKMIAQFCEEFDIPIFAANPSLVQHIGFETTGCCPPGNQHVSRSFTFA